jgi:hypothetical protein
VGGNHWVRGPAVRWRVALGGVREYAVHTMRTATRRGTVIRMAETMAGIGSAKASTYPTNTKGHDRVTDQSLDGPVTRRIRAETDVV